MMMLSKQSFDRALRALEKDLEHQQRRIDEDLQSVRNVIRLVSESDEGNKAASTFSHNLTDALYSVLKEEGPLHRNELVVRVKKKGVHIGGESPANNLGTYLSRDSRFKNVGRGIWALEEDDPIESAHSNGREGVSLAALGTLP